MELKKLFAAGLVTLGVSFSISAQASSLTIVNNTNHDSTSIINYGLCSTILGESGITRAHSTNVVDESMLKKACFFNKSNCRADVYMTNNCTGPKVAMAIFDINSGLKSIEKYDQSYDIQGDGFKITMSGGPA